MVCWFFRCFLYFLVLHGQTFHLIKITLIVYVMSQCNMLDGQAGND